MDMRSFLDTPIREILRFPRRAKTKNSTITYKLSDPRLQKIFARGDDAAFSDPYTQLAAYYACVNAKASNVAQVPWLITKIGSDKVIEQGGIVDLFANPNPTLSSFQLWEAVIVSLENKGEWFIVKDREVGTDGVPAFLWLINPSFMMPARAGQGGPWVGWWITRNGKREFLAREEVLFDKYYNPNDEIRGLAPFTAARLSGEADYEAQRYNRNFFKNDATPSTVFKFTEFLSDPQYQQEKERLIESRRNNDGANDANRRTLLMDGGASVEALGLSQRDMEFTQLHKLTLADICMITRTPRSVIAINEDVNYANATAADRRFWMQVLIPLMIRIQAKFNKDLLHPLGYAGHFDFKQIDAVASAWMDKIGSAVQLINLGYTLNQINARLQLGFEDVEWGDEPRAPAPALPAPAPAKAIPTDYTEGPAPKQIVSEAVEKAKRARAWQEINGKALPLVVKCGQDVKAYYRKAGEKLYKKLFKAAHPANVVQKMGEVDPAIVDDIFDDSELSHILEKWINLSLSTGAGSVLGSSFDLTDPLVQAAVSRHTSKVVEINANARQQLQDIIRETTQRAVSEGMTEQQAADLLTENVKAKLTQFDHHARTVARTEVHGAYSEGRYEGMKTTFPMGKKWISSRDVRVRDSHASLDGRSVQWEQAFANGLQYPLDPAGDAAEVINCRCVMVPVYEGDSQ